MGVKRLDKRGMNELMEELMEEVGVRESHEEAGEEQVKVGWTRGNNGRETVDKERGCVQCRIEGEEEDQKIWWECEGIGEREQGMGEWKWVVATAVIRDR